MAARTVGKPGNLRTANEKSVGNLTNGAAARQVFEQKTQKSTPPEDGEGGLDTWTGQSTSTDSMSRVVRPLA